MLKFLEHLYIKYLGNTKGYDFNMCDWDIVTLHRKFLTGQQYTKAEKHALKFLEDMKVVLDIWDPPKKWGRPYGKILNEQRKLH